MEPTLDQVTEVIEASGAMIVALQEVDVDCPRTDGVNQAAEIGRRLGLNTHFYCLVEWDQYPHFPEPVGQYGLAFLCHPDLHPHRVSQWKLPLRRTTSEPRGIFQIEIDWQGTPIMILNTHLSVQRSERLHQLQAICQRIDYLRQHEEPCILMGDLNTTGVTRELRFLHRRLPECISRTSPRATFPSRFPLLRLDRVFASSCFDCLDSRVINSPLARRASDHLPVQVDLGR